MHRSLLCVVLLALPAAAHADDRLDLALPDLPLLESSYHLDRDQPYEERSNSGYVGWIGAGVAHIDDHATPTGTAALGVGRHSETLIALWRSDLDADAVHGVRGRHRGLLELRSAYDSDTGIDQTLTGSVEHGEAHALAPLRLGPGARETGDLASETLFRLGTKKNDATWIAMVRGELGGTHWEPGSAPSIDHESHRAVSLGWGVAPSDSELPRGHLDVLRGRVEQERITARGFPSGTPRTIGTVGGEVRTAEVGLGSNQMTLHIDHQLLAIIDADLGWSWIESDTSTGRISDNAFRMHLSTAVKWKPDGEHDVRRIGLDIARLPSVTPDGQRIVGDWRLELHNGIETKNYLLDARGGISWIVPFAAAQSLPAVQTLIRYGVQLEAMARLGGELEAGLYHASSYESRIAGDPWASGRRWSVETGVLARIRK